MESRAEIPIVTWPTSYTCLRQRHRRHNPRRLSSCIFVICHQLSATPTANDYGRGRGAGLDAPSGRYQVPIKRQRTTPFPDLCVSRCVCLDGTTLSIADDFGNAGKGKRFRPVSCDRDKIEDYCTVRPQLPTSQNQRFVHD